MFLYNKKISEKYKFRILIVGFGNIGKKHCKNLISNFKNIEIGLVSNKDLINEIKKFKNKRIYLYKSLLSSLNFNPNAVIISTPSNLHYKQSCFYIKKNINVFVEKPVFNKLQKITILKKNISKNNNLYLVGYNLRYSKLLNNFKSYIDKKIVGKIYYVNCVVGKDLKTWNDDNYTKKISGKKNKGGGVMLELSHEIDYLNWIFGDFKNVYASLSKVSNLKINVEDNVVAIFELEEKIKNFKIFLHMDFVRKDNTRFIEVIGSKGTIKIDLIKGRIEHFSGNNNVWKILNNDTSHLVNSYKNQFFNFFNHLFHSNDLINNLDQSYEVLKIIDSMKKSNLYNKKINI